MIGNPILNLLVNHKQYFIINHNIQFQIINKGQLVKRKYFTQKK